MIVLDSTSKIVKFLEKNNLLSSSTIFNAEVFSLAELNKYDLYLIAEEDLTLEVEQKLSEMVAIIVWGSHKRENIKNFKLRIISYIDSREEEDLILNQILTARNLCLVGEELRSELIQYNSKLNETISYMEEEMVVIKKLHEKFYPLRQESTRGVKIFSKYAAGLGTGGEFFDIIKNKNKILFFMSSTSSYLVSSSIITHFSFLKNNKIIDEVETNKFLKDLISDFKGINETRGNEIRLDCFLAVLDISTQTLSSKVFGNFNILNSTSSKSILGNTQKLNLENSEEASFPVKLENEERILIMSPGLIKNLNELKTTFNYNNLINDKNINPQDIIDEIFFQLKKENEFSFLKSDATLLFLEIDKNAVSMV